MRRLSFLLFVGLGAAWGVCRLVSPCYEAVCECEVSFGNAADGGFEETLNTRIAVWRAELGDVLAGVDIRRVPRSRLMAVTARGARAEDVAGRANAAAVAVASYAETAGVARAEAALAQMHGEVERLRRDDERLDVQLREFRMANAADGGPSGRRMLEQGLERATQEIIEQERRVREAGAWADFLEVARTRAQDLGAFPASVPEDSEVRRAHRAWSAARGRLASLRTKYTEAHPEVDAAKIALVAAAKDFADVLVGASKVAEDELASAKNRLRELRRRASGLRAELEGMDIRNAEASDGMERLREKKKVARSLYEEALVRESGMRMAAGRGAESVRVVRAAAVPSRPRHPDQALVYSIGAGAPVALWLLLGILWPSAPRRRARRA